MNPMPPDLGSKELAESVTETMHQHDRVLALFKMEIKSVDCGYARISMQVTKDMLNGFHILHGGVTFTLADTAFAYACNSRNQLTVAASAKIKFLKMVQPGDKLTAAASERTLEGGKGLYEVVVKNQDDVLVAIFEGNSQALDEKVHSSSA